MDSEKKGVIVSTQLAKLPNSDIEYGYITIETDEREHLKLKVDSYTQYDNISRGQKVKITIKPLDSKHFVAREIRNLD